MPSPASPCEPANLFTTWQRARGVDHHPLTPALVQRFLDEVPAGRKFITGLFTHPQVAPLEVIRAIPAYGAIRHRVSGGLWGRRDAVIVWLRHLGLSRTQIHCLDTPRLADLEPRFARRDDPRACPACVLARWRHVLGVLPPWGGKY